MGQKECNRGCPASGGSPDRFPGRGCGRCRSRWLSGFIGAISSSGSDLDRSREQLEHLIEEMSELRELDALYVLNFALYVVRTEIDLRGAGLADNQPLPREIEPGHLGDFVRA